jgi:hypothetical protein
MEENNDRSVIEFLTAIFPCCLWENEGRRGGSHSYLFCCPFSVRVTRAALLQWLENSPMLALSLPPSPSYVLNWLLGKTEGLVWAPVVTRRGGYNYIRCPLVGINSVMACSGLGLEEQEICPWVLTDLALAWREGHFSTHTLTHINGNDLHWIVIYWTALAADYTNMPSTAVPF